MAWLQFLGLVLSELTHAQTGVMSPIAEACGPSVVCINRYANVLP